MNELRNNSLVAFLKAKAVNEKVEDQVRNAVVFLAIWCRVSAWAAHWLSALHRPPGCLCRTVRLV
jgi:hypothetical protein